VDLINTVRIILEQNHKWNSALYATFVDSEKAFDSLKRRYLWKVLQQYGIPEKILNLIKEMYRNYECKVTHEGKVIEAFQVCSGVRQERVLSPTLFVLVLDDIMRTVIADRKKEIFNGV
jgi:hypothetical protein